MVTLVAQYTGKLTNLEKAIYFLSLMSCSINNVLYLLTYVFSHNNPMLFACFFMFSNFTWKKIPSLPPFFYSPDENEYLRKKLIFTNNQPQKYKEVYNKVIKEL